MSNDSSPHARAALHGLGTALPEQILLSSDIETRLGLSSGWIERHTGIRARRVAAPGELPSHLAAQAITRACADADITPDHLGAVIHGAASTDQLIPCTAALIARKLDIAGRTCLDVDATCLSFLAALDLAALWVGSGAHKYVAVASAEVASLGVDWTEPASAVLMGDAAAAVIVGPARGTSRLYPALLRTFPAGSSLAELPGYGVRHSPSDPATTAHHNLFHMQGPKLFRFATEHATQAVSDHLTAIAWRQDEVALVPHQASAHALRSAARRCGFRPEQTLENIAERGNCLAASIPLLLAEACADGRILPGHRVLLAGTAAGVTVGAMALVR